MGIFTASTLARQISGLEGFERLRGDEPQSRNDQKWSVQLQGFCQKVSDLYDRIAQGEVVQESLLQQVSHRIDKIAGKNCTKENRQMIAAAQKAMQQIASGDVYLRPISRSNETQQPLFPSIPRTWGSFLLHALHLQGTVGWFPRLVQRSNTVAQQNLPSSQTVASSSIPQASGIQTNNKSSSLSLGAIWNTISSGLGIFGSKRIPDQSMFLSSHPTLDSNDGNDASTIKPSHQRNPNCLTSDCPNLDRSKLHPRELEAVDSGFRSFFDFRFFSSRQEWLRFRKDDPRPKLLFVAAQSDGNGALNPKYLYYIIRTLDSNFDIKYRVVTSFEEICEEIEQGIKTGKLTYVIINGHGNPVNGVQLDDWDSVGMFSSHSKCFSNFIPNGKIILLSCSTAKTPNLFGDIIPFPFDLVPLDHVSQKIANKAKRNVIAAVAPIGGSETEILSISPLIFYHPTYEIQDGQLTKISENLMRLIRPRYSSCPDLIEESLPPYEKAVADVVKNDLITKLVLPKIATFKDVQDYLRICEEDPKSKFLYLVSETEKPEPHSISNFLINAEDKFDLQIKTFQSSEDICKEVDAATRLNPLAVLLIQANGTSMGLFPNSNFPKCLASKVSFFGKTVLVGDSLNSIAHEIAKNTRRTVMVSNAKIDGRKLTLRSDDPPEIHHPSPHWFWGETDTNSFTEVQPPLGLPSPCSGFDLKLDAFHPNEKAAFNATSEKVKSKRGFFAASPSFGEMQEYFRLCPEDPKPKFIYLVSDKDHSGVLNPEYVSNFFIDVASKFDIQVKTIQWLDDICDEADKANKIGEVAAIAISTHATNGNLEMEERPAFLLKRIYNWISGNQFPNCLSRIPSSAQVILLPINSGNSVDPSLADTIAQKANKKVQAPTSAMHGVNDQVILDSSDPLEISYQTKSTEGFFSGLFWKKEKLKTFHQKS